MDNEKIKELIKEYAEEALNDWCTKDIQIVEPWHCVVEDLSHIAEIAIQKLSDKFCIVEKEKIKALYSKMELDGNHVDSDNDWAVYEAMDELEKIFGEELFNDKEK